MRSVRFPLRHFLLGDDLWYFTFYIILSLMSTCRSGFQQASCNGACPKSPHIPTLRLTFSESKSSTLLVNPQQQQRFSKPSPKQLKQSSASCLFQEYAFQIFCVVGAHHQDNLHAASIHFFISDLGKVTA